MNILVTRRLPGTSLQDLIDHYDEVTVLEKERPLTKDELRDALKDKFAAICVITDQMNSETIPDSLKFIATYSVGVDHVDLSFCKEKRISLSYTPDTLTDATADFTWALILSVSRKLHQGSQYVCDKKFEGYGPELFLGGPLSNGILGIVGMGKIGTAVAQRALGFGMKILYHSPQPLPKDIETSLSAKKVSLEDVFKFSDIVTLHCPLKPETKHLIGEKELSLMKENAVLVNTARGPILDEAALIAHLKKHPDIQAGLDVYEREPEISDELLNLPNAYCQPHIASADRATREKIAKMCVDEAIRFAKGEELRYQYPL